MRIKQPTRWMMSSGAGGFFKSVDWIDLFHLNV